MTGQGGFFPFAKKQETRRRVSESNDTLPPRTAFISALNLLLCSILIPFMLGGNETATYALALAACLTSTIVVFISAKKISHAVIYTAALVLSLGMFTLPLLPALTFGTVVAIGSGASLISTAKGWRASLAPITVALSLIISIIVCGDIIIAITSLAMFVPTVVMGIASRKKSAVSVAVIAGSASMLFALILALLATLYEIYGEISLEAINHGIDSIAADLITYTEMSLDELMDIEINEAMHNYVVEMVDYYINLSPGMMIATCTVISYLAHKIELSTLEVHGIDELLDDNTTELSMGIITPFVYVIALVLSFSLDPHNNVSVVAVVADNLCLIFAPGLLVMASRVIRILPGKLGFIGLLISGALILFMILAFCYFPMSIPLVGAGYVIAIHIDAWAKEHYSKGDNQ